MACLYLLSEAVAAKDFYVNRLLFTLISSAELVENVYIHRLISVQCLYILIAVFMAL